MWLLKQIIGFPAKVKLWLFGAGGVVALLAALKTYIYFEKREAAKDAVKDYTDDQAAKEAEVREDARREVAKEKRETDRLSDSDVADRVRRRTSRWDRL